MGDVEVALAFVAARQARRSMPAAEWAHVLSFGLGWMPPNAARAFVGRAESAGLLAPDDGQLRLVLDPASVAVPLHFRPHPDAQPEVRAKDAPVDGFVAWLETYARHAGCDRAEALRRIAARQADLQGLLTADAALLWLASEAGLDVRGAAARLIAPPAAAAAAPR